MNCQEESGTTFDMNMMIENLENIDDDVVFKDILSKLQSDLKNPLEDNEAFITHAKKHICVLENILSKLKTQIRTLERENELEYEPENNKPVNSYWTMAH